MKKLHEYREHAAECREMARTAPPTHRQQLEQMAATWDQLASARERKLKKLGHAEDVAEDGETVRAVNLCAPFGARSDPVPAMPSSRPAAPQNFVCS